MAHLRQILRIVVDLAVARFVMSPHGWKMAHGTHTTFQDPEKPMKNGARGGFRRGFLWIFIGNVSGSVGGVYNVDEFRVIFDETL